jgi:hypothetical protein
MRFARLLFFVLLALPIALAQEGLDAELAAVTERFKAAFDRQYDIESKAMAPAKAAYIREIEKIRDDAKVKDNLDGALEAETILRAIKDGTPPPKAKIMESTIAPARGRFERARDAALKLHLPSRTRIEVEYDRSLQEIEQRTTRAGDLAAANRVRDLRSLASVLGTWDFKNSADGHRATLEVNPDNTFTAAGKRVGTWEIQGQVLIFTHDANRGHHDRWELPVKNGKLTGTNTLGHAMTLIRK